jgi:tripartite-type tricarboxylate transporter receptor subunit TctC
MPFSVEKDLQPITVLATGEQVVVVHPSVPAKTLQELVALAKQKPGALNYASAGVGTSIHLGAELLKMRAGIDMTQVPYKGGGPAAAAVLGGEVQVLVGTVASTIAFIQAGRLRALASTGLKRSKLTPDLPTVAESGYPGFDAGLWFRAARAERNAEEHHRAHTQGSAQRAAAPRRADRNGAPGPGARAEQPGGACRAHQEGDRHVGGAHQDDRDTRRVNAGSVEAWGAAHPVN